VNCLLLLSAIRSRSYPKIGVDDYSAVEYSSRGKNDLYCQCKLSNVLLLQLHYKVRVVRQARARGVLYFL